MRTITFTIYETRDSEPVIVTKDVDVCDEWDSLAIDEKREFLIKPRSATEIHGESLFPASRFQEAYDYPVYDFEFAELPNTRCSGGRLLV